MNKIEPCIHSAYSTMDTPTKEETNEDTRYIIKKITSKAHAITVYGNRCWFHGFTTGLLAGLLAGIGVTSVISLSVILRQPILRN